MPKSFDKCVRRGGKVRTITGKNAHFEVPEGHIPMIRALMVPIIYRGELIGLFEVAVIEVILAPGGFATRRPTSSDHIKRPLPLWAAALQYLLR